MPTNTWIAAAPGLASDPANWSLGRIPELGDDIVLSAVSANNMSWDLALDLASFDMAAFPSGSYINLSQPFSCTSLLGSTAGAFMDGNKVVTCHGNASYPNSNVTRYSLVMDGEGSTIKQAAFTNALDTITIKANIATAGTINAYYLATDAGKSLSIGAGHTAYVYLYNGNVTNNGSLEGDGKIVLYPRYAATKNLALGVCNVDVEIRGYSSTTVDNSVTLAADTHLGGDLLLQSDSAYLTSLLHGSNYALQVDGVTTLGIRGIMSQGTAAWSFNGGYVQNGSASVFNQGAADVNVGGTGFSYTAGSFNGNINNWLHCDGPYSAPSVGLTVYSLNVEMTKDGSAFSGNVSYFGTLKFSANTLYDSVNGLSYTRRLEVAPGKSVSIAQNKTLCLYANANGIMAIDNQGSIDGLGTLEFLIKSEDPTFVLGEISCRLYISGHSGSSANRTLYLGAGTHLLGSLVVDSQHATNTMTLHHGSNYALEVDGTTTLSTRGQLTQGTAAWDLGTYVQSGASSVMNVGSGNINASTVNQTNGTIAFNASGNVGRVITTGDVSLTGGSVTITQYYQGFESAGNVLISGYSWQSNNGLIRMTGDDKTLTSSANPAILEILANVSTGWVPQVIAKFTLAEGKTLTITTNGTVHLYHLAMSESDIRGTIRGGTLVLRAVGTRSICSMANATLECNVEIYTYTGGSADATYSLTSDLICTGTIKVYSISATYLGILNLNGYTLQGSLVTIDTLGQITGAGTINAPLTVSVGAFNPTGRVDIMGLLTVSGGTITEGSNDIHCYGGVITTAGTVTGPTNYLYSFVLHECDLTQNGGTFTGTTVSVKTIGACTVTMGNTMCALIATAGSVVHKTTGNTISSRIETGEGAEIILDTSCELRYYASSTYVNKGRISGPSTLQFSLYNGDKTIDFGDISCDVRIRALSVAIADQKLTLAAPMVSAPNVSVDSQHGSYKCTFDLAGFDNTLHYVTVGTLGKLIGNVGRTTYTGAWDTSLGEWDPMTGEVVQGGSGTVKLAAGQSFYDFRAEVLPMNLASDVIIEHDYIHARSAILNGYALTLLQAEREVRLFDQASRHSAALSAQARHSGSLTAIKRLRGQYGGS